MVAFEDSVYEWCLVCGGPSFAPDPKTEAETVELEEEKKAIRANLAGLEWLNTFVGVLETEELIPLGCYDRYGGFDNADESRPPFLTAFSLTLSDPGEGQCGLACHEKCFKVLQRDLGYTLRYQDVWPLLMEEKDELHNSFEWNCYGGMHKYYGENKPFEYSKLVADGNTWMLQDPLTNGKNAQRIVEIWRTLMHDGFKKEDEHNTSIAEASTTVPAKDSVVVPAKDSEVIEPAKAQVVQAAKDEVVPGKVEV